MSEDQENVVEETHTEEVVQPQEEQSSSSSPQETSQQNSAEYNFRRMREVKEQLERENRELKERMSASSSPKEEDEFGFDDDDLVEGKVVKKLYKDLKKFQQSYEQEKLAEVPQRLRSKFSDFDQVVSEENIEKLKYSEPELFSSIVSGQDPFAKGVSAYKTIKALGFADQDVYKSQKAAAERNSQKPLSSQAIKGQGALADTNIFANGLTPELKQQLIKEMREAARGS